MNSSGILLFGILQCSLLLFTKADDGHPIRGVPGIDYPDYQSIPYTSFRCFEHIPGLYADPETGCQMFHHCYEHRQESFLCPPGTIFNQAILACDYWYSAECSASSASHYSIKAQRESKNIGSAPVKNPSVNIFNKLASLYEESGPLSTDSNFEESNLVYAKGTDEHNYVNGDYQEYENSILKASSIHDGREGETETYGNLSFESKNGDRFRTFGEFESSGEPDEFGELENSDEFSSLNDAEDAIYEKQNFLYDGDFENGAEHRMNHEEFFSDIQVGKENVSENLKLEDKLIKRQSKVIGNYMLRKPKRRKPKYTIVEPEQRVKESTTTETPQHGNDLKLNKPNDSSSSTQDSVTTPISEPIRTVSKTKRRKPVLIQLEDSYEYNVDNAKISSIKYGNPQSNIAGFSMDAEEISVQLFPSDTKRTPINKLLQQQFINQNSNEEMKSLNNIENHESDIYHTSTLSTIGKVENFHSSKNFNEVFPKRKRNTFRIIDSENQHDVYTENEPTEITTFASNFENYGEFNEFQLNNNDEEKTYEIAVNNPEFVQQLNDNNEEYVKNEELEDATIFTSVFENDFTTQTTDTNFEEYKKYTEIQFAYRDIEKYHDRSDGISKLVTHREDNHNLNVETDELEETTTFVPSFEEFTTPSVSTNFKDYGEFSELEEVSSEVQDHYIENGHEIEGDLSNLSERIEDNDGIYIADEETSDEATHISVIEDEYTTQYPYTNFEDFNEIFYPNFDERNIETNKRMENSDSDLVSEEFENSYSSFSTPYPHLEKLYEPEDTYFNQINPGALLDEQEYENRDFIGQINDFSNYESFEEIDSSAKEAEDYSSITTKYSIPEISQVPNLDEETNQFHYDPESTFDESDTSEYVSHMVSDDEINDIAFESNNASNYTTENDLDEHYSPYEGIQNNNITSETEHFRVDEEQEITFADSTKDSFNEPYEPSDIISYIDSKEMENFSHKDNESNIETVQNEFEFDHNVHQSYEPIDAGSLDKMALANIENQSFEDSEIDSEDLTKILDDLENHDVAQNDAISDQEHVFSPKKDFDGKVKFEDSTGDKTMSNTETNIVNKELSNLPQNNRGNIIKDKPIRMPRVFMPSNTRDFNFEKFRRDFNFNGLGKDFDFEKFGSQSFAGAPYSMLQFKQKSLKKYLGSSKDGYGVKGIEDLYSSRTGDFLESPKISKLISIGKNLLNAKKAKLRILRKLVNY